MAFCDDADNGGGRHRAHFLLQLAANPISSLCCALVAVRSTAQLGSGLNADAHRAGAAISSADSNSHDDRQNGRWGFQALKGPWSRTHGNSSQGPSGATAPAASAKQSHTALAITGQIPLLH